MNALNISMRIGVTCKIVTASATIDKQPTDVNGAGQARIVSGKPWPPNCYKLSKPRLISSKNCHAYGRCRSSSHV